MSEYQLKSNGYIYRRRDGAWIPPMANNADYVEYLNWVAAGGVTDPPSPDS